MYGIRFRDLSFDNSSYQKYFQKIIIAAKTISVMFPWWRSKTEESEFPEILSFFSKQPQPPLLVVGCFEVKFVRCKNNSLFTSPHSWYFSMSKDVSSMLRCLFGSHSAVQSEQGLCCRVLRWRFLCPHFIHLLGNHIVELVMTSQSFELLSFSGVW